MHLLIVPIFETATENQLLAAMSAKGTSEIGNISQIDRGYENIDSRLNALGACIKRID